MKVLVTGGAGYIGCHLVPELLAAGHELVVLDSLDYGDRGLTSFIGHPRVRFVRGDICNVRDLIRGMEGAEVVVALAAIVGDPACALNYDDTIATNFESTKLLIEAAVYRKARRLVFASTCSVYGASSDLLLNEGSWLNPVSAYARTRIMSEDLLLANLARIESTILRLGTLFGWSPRMRFDLVINLMTADGVYKHSIAVHGGSQWRPLLHCRDAARAFRLAAEAESSQVAMQVFNVGDDDLNLTVLEMAGRVARLLPEAKVEVHPEQEDRRDYRVSFEKIRHILGFRCGTSLEQGVAEMTARLREEPLDYRNDIYYNVRYRREHPL